MQWTVRISWLVVVWVDWLGMELIGSNWLVPERIGLDWLVGHGPSPPLSLSLSCSLARSFQNGLFMRSSSDVHRTLIFILLETVVGSFFVYYQFDF